jgi:hypothetical protein
VTVRSASSGSRRWRGPLFRLAVAAAVLVVAALACLLVLRMHSEARLDRARRTLEEAGVAGLPPPERRSANESAVRIDELTALLGVKRFPAEGATAPPPAFPTPEPAAWRSTLSYVIRSRNADMPPDLAAWASATQGPMEEVVDLLCDRPLPIWASEGDSDRVPDTLGLNHALLLRAATSRDPARVERALLASWNLSRAMLDQGHVISPLMAIAALRVHAEIGAQAPVDPVAWEERYGTLRLEPHLHGVFDRDLADLVRTTRDDERARMLRGPWTKAVAPARRAITRALAPAAWASVVEESMRRRSLVDGAGPCADLFRIDADAYRSRGWLERPFPEWRNFATPYPAILRSRQLAVEAEMTRRILAAKALRAQGRLPAGAKLAELLGPPRVDCPDIRFDETVLAGGRLHVIVTGLPWVHPPNAVDAPRPMNWIEPLPR